MPEVFTITAVVVGSCLGLFFIELCKKRSISEVCYVNMKSYLGFVKTEDSSSSNSSNAEKYIDKDICNNLDCDQVKSYRKVFNDINIQNCLSDYGLESSVSDSLVNLSSNTDRKRSSLIKQEENTEGANGCVKLNNACDENQKIKKRKLLKIGYFGRSGSNTSQDKLCEKYFEYPDESAEKSVKVCNNRGGENDTSGLHKELPVLQSSYKEESLHEEYLTCTDSENESESLIECNQRIKLCRACDDKEANSVARPCGHSYLCYDCAVKIFYLRPVCAFCSNRVIKCEKNVEMY